MSFLIVAAIAVVNLSKDIDLGNKWLLGIGEGYEPKETEKRTKQAQDSAPLRACPELPKVQKWYIQILLTS